MLRGLIKRLRLYTLTLAEIVENKADDFINLKTLNLSRVCDGIRLETGVYDENIKLPERYRTEFDIIRGRVILEYMLATEYYRLSHPGQLEDWKKALLGELRIMLDPGLVELSYSEANRLMGRLEIAVSNFINKHVMKVGNEYRFDLVINITKEVNVNGYIPVMWVYDYLVFGGVDET